MISIKSTENTLLSIMDHYCESQRAAMNINNFATHTDVLLIMNDGIIPAHAVILQAVSPFFEAIFASQGPNYVGMREILLPDFSVAIMKSVVKLIYSKEVYLKDEKEVSEVLIAMSLFCLRTSENVSLQKLHESLSNKLNEISQSTNNNKVHEEVLVYSKNKSSNSHNGTIKMNKPNANLITTNQAINHNNNYSSTAIGNANSVPKKSQLQPSSISYMSSNESEDQQRTLNMNKTELGNISVIKPSHKNQSPDPRLLQKSHFNTSTKQPPSKRIKLLEEQLNKETLKSLKDCIVHPHKKDGKTYVFVFRKKSHEKNAI